MNKQVIGDEVPLVSIVILNYNHPEIIDICLRTLPITDEIPYEVVVVDNGSEPETVEALKQHKEEGRINKLVLEPVNHFFSEGNNIGVRHTNSFSKYILLLNSDVAFRRPDWLKKQVGWMEGTTKSWPTVWGVLSPTYPEPGTRDIVSIGWSHDANIDGNARPEGWCCMIRRSWWRDLSPDLPFHGGFEEAIAQSIREGARAGVLCMYGEYLVHREGGSGKANVIQNRREPDFAAWFSGLKIETLDFRLGENEHDTYMEW